LIGGEGDAPGRVRVYDTVFSLPSAQPTGTGPAFVLPINPEFRVALDVDGNVSVVGPLFRAIAQGTVLTTGRLTAPVLTGHLTTSRGTLYYPTATFRISEGTADFTIAPPAPARIDLSLRARTTVGPYQITLSVFGPFQNLRFDIVSNPPLPQSRLLALVLGQEQIEALLRGQDIETLLQTETLRILTAQIEPRILVPFELAIQEALGLEEFAIEFGVQRPFRVVFSRRLFDDIYLSYLQTLSGPGGVADVTGVEDRYRFTLSYRISPTLQVGISSNDQQIHRLTLEGTFRF